MKGKFRKGSFILLKRALTVTTVTRLQGVYIILDVTWSDALFARVS